MTKSIPPLALAAVAGGAQALLTRSRRPSRASRTAAITLAAPSLYFLVGSVNRFRRVGTTVDPRPGTEAAALVVSGPNAKSRNPMYVGMAGLLLAHSTARRSLLATAPAVLFTAWIDQVQIPMEEAHLRSTFGEEFVAYASTVRRWL